jgi:hypothetical protein
VTTQNRVCPSPMTKVCPTPTLMTRLDFRIDGPRQWN